ncbi:MAG TPA: FkbM family methyltransferase [Pyrinomonadaceae bacterium]|jgi:FkbM family methyltransferase
MSIKSKVEGMKAIWRFDNRWELLLSRTLFRNDNLNIYRIKGMEILVDHGAGDPNGARHVLVSSMYQRFLSRMELNGSLNVLDLGANGGGFPLMLHVNKLRLGKLACVEFNPNTFSRLRFNIERNLKCEFTGINAAICGERRELQVQLGSGSTGDSIYQPSPEQSAAGSVYRIDGLTFDDIYNSTFQDEVVDICKMDVEGAEYEVFASAHHECIKRCRYLIVEIHNVEDRRPEEVVSELKRQGFEEIAVDSKTDPDVHLFGNTRFNHQTL